MAEITYQQQRVLEIKQKLEELHIEAQELIRKVLGDAINNTEYTGESANATYNATSEMDANHEQYMQETNERDDATYSKAMNALETGSDDVISHANQVDTTKI